MKDSRDIEGQVMRIMAWTFENFDFLRNAFEFQFKICAKK